VKKISPDLNDVLIETVKIINFIKSIAALNCKLYSILCEVMGSEHSNLLMHEGVRRLSHSCVLARFVELRKEI